MTKSIRRLRSSPAGSCTRHRFLGAERINLTGHSAYYGSIDATPLFVMMLGELCRWGIDDGDLQRLLPHADRAMEWMERYGDRDGDGFLEYLRSSDRGLVNQGWKDSGDAIRYSDGRVAVAPLALCEVQGYAYAAWRARATIAERLGDDVVHDRCTTRAAELKERFDREFWLHDRGWFAVALGPDKEPVDSLTSNIGHCLWTGIVDDDRAEEVAKALLSPAMWTGWGIRTLAANERGFDPMSYHCGSVWPHDNALSAAGLARYGFMDASMTVINGLLDASEAWNGRLPEFFCGLDRADVATPIPMPTSCSPQAWSSAAPLLLLRLLLGLEPDDAHGLVVSFDAAVASSMSGCAASTVATSCTTCGAATRTASFGFADVDRERQYFNQSVGNQSVGASTWRASASATPAPNACRVTSIPVSASAGSALATATATSARANIGRSLVASPIAITGRSESPRCSIARASPVPLSHPVGTIAIESLLATT